MNKGDLRKIKVLIWDLDGTLYQSQKDLLEAMHGAQVKILEEHKNLSFEQASLLLEESVKIHKGVTKSLSSLGCGDRVSIIKRIENLVNKAAFLKVDTRLQCIFRELSLFKHYLLSDTTHETIEKELSALGLSSSIFEHIVGVDDTKTTKPDLSFFKSALNYSNLSAGEHLSIGDRIQIDLMPAKQLGMKTCLVWGSSNDVDISLPTVYDVVQLFTD